MIVKNRTRGPLVLNLEHAAVCSDDACLCATMEHRSRELNRHTGESGIRIVERRVSASVHVMPGQSAGLPDGADRAADVAAAIRRGDLVTVS